MLNSNGCKFSHMKLMKTYDKKYFYSALFFGQNITDCALKTIKMLVYTENP